jgi:hypothetical protein
MKDVQNIHRCAGRMTYCAIPNPVTSFLKFQGGAQIYNLADMLQH